MMNTNAKKDGPVCRDVVLGAGELAREHAVAGIRRLIMKLEWLQKALLRDDALTASAQLQEVLLTVAEINKAVHTFSAFRSL